MENHKPIILVVGESCSNKTLFVQIAREASQGFIFTEAVSFFLPPNKYDGYIIFMNVNLFVSAQNALNLINQIIFRDGVETKMVCVGTYDRINFGSAHGAHTMKVIKDICPYYLLEYNDIDRKTIKILRNFL